MNTQTINFYNTLRIADLERLSDDIGFELVLSDGKITGIVKKEENDNE